MKELVEIPIYLNKDTVDLIQRIVSLENNKNLIYKPERFSHNSINDFITGCIYTYLKQIQQQDNLTGIEELAKPFTLKNRFKEIAEKKHLRGKDLVEMTNINAGNISYILSNRNQPSLDYFLRIWIALGCPPLNECLYREETESDG
jgi:DNA-binding Xre family transcriptional regulator